MQARKLFTRLARFMDPLKAVMGDVREKPAQKLTTAGAERVPPAPWVKTRVEVVDLVGGV